MNSSTVNFTSPEAHPSTNLTSHEDSVMGDSLMSSLLFFNVVVGFPLQSYVLWLITTGRGIAAEIFSANLTICGIIFSLNLLVYILLPTFPRLVILCNFLVGLIITGRPLFQCLICVERYLAVIHPVTFLKYKPLRYRLMCCAVAWFFTLVSCLCSMSAVTVGSYALILIYSVQFLLFFSIQLFCCVAVLRALKQSGPGEREREREEENNMKRRAFHLILITTVTMFIMFIPYIITGFLSVVGQQVISLGWFISLACFTLTAFVHPVLYLHRTGKLFCFHSTCNYLRQ